MLQCYEAASSRQGLFESKRSLNSYKHNKGKQKQKQNIFILNYHKKQRSKTKANKINKYK